MEDKKEVKHAGSMAIDTGLGTRYGNCGLATRPSLAELAAVFAEGGELHGYMMVGVPFVNDAGASCFFTLELNEEELWVLNERSSVINQMVEERKAARIKARREEEEQKEKEGKEVKRMAAIGEAYEKKMAAIKQMDPSKQRKELEKALYNGKDPELTNFAENQLKALGLEFDTVLQDGLKSVVEAFVANYFSERAKADEVNNAPPV